MNYPTRPGSSVILDLPDHAYHSLPELSSSQAKALLESPAKFNYWRGKRRPDKKEYDVGHAVHAKVLGTGANVVEIPSDLLAKNGAISTSAAKQWVEAERAKGNVPMKTDELRPINEMAEAILRHPRAKELLERPGRPEVSIVTTDEESGVGIRCRFDYLPYSDGSFTTAVDLKTTGKSASAEGFALSVLNFGYDIQRAFYLHTLKTATGIDGEIEFVVVETEPPYLVGVHQLDPMFIEMGERKTRRAIEWFNACMTTGIWPGLPTEVQLVSPPPFAVIQFEEMYENQEINVA